MHLVRLSPFGDFLGFKQVAKYLQLKFIGIKTCTFSFIYSK